ncbi:MAG TPA: hypothetical protein VF576_12350, partial [Rubricoccaceae bacterium]
MRLCLGLLLLAAASARAQTPDSTALPDEAPTDSSASPDIDATFEALLEDDVDGDPTELLELLTDLRERP